MPVAESDATSDTASRTSTASSKASSRTAKASLDPDALAELEREQAFLLRSLDDLDDEHGAGDLDDVDHVQLTDDYTRRLAEVTRAIDEKRTAFESVDNRLGTTQRVLTFAGIVILAVVAGVLLARASGFRSPTDSLSGDIRQNSAGLLAEADTLTREGRWEDAILVYEEVLDTSPANIEALTYRGWITAQLGDPEGGLDGLAEAVAVDPDFPDARVFRAILFERSQQFDAAADELAVLDGLDVPEQMTQLIDGAQLRASVAGGQIQQRFGTPGTPVDLSQINADLDDISLAGGAFVSFGDAELAARVFRAVIAEDPENITSLIGLGNVLTIPDVVELAPDSGAQGLEFLDRAVELDGSAAVLLTRANARFGLGDVDGAAADLAAIDPEQLPESLRGPYEGLLSATS